MLDEPRVDRAALLTGVFDGWGIEVAESRFLPRGLDAEAWAYEIRLVDGQRLFLKVRRAEPGPASVTVPRALYERGVPSILAPIPPVTGRPWHRVGEHRLVLYPFLDGDNCWDSGLTDAQWIAYGRLLAALHDSTPPAGTTVPTEDFAPAAPDRIRTVAALIASVPNAERRDVLVDLYRRHRAAIEMLADRTDRLARLAAGSGATPVLCHADAHSGNLLADPDGTLWMVDWDTLMWAPRELDLIFVLGQATFGDQPVRPAQADLFARGYGALDVDPTVVGYYAHLRVANDIAEFTTSLCDPDATDATWHNDLYWLSANLAADGDRLAWDRLR